MPFCPADGSTASACEIRGSHGIPWNYVKYTFFMEHCEFHVRNTRKQSFVPEAENISKTDLFAWLGGRSGAFGARMVKFPEFHPF